MESGLSRGDEDGGYGQRTVLHVPGESEAEQAARDALTGTQRSILLKVGFGEKDASSHGRAPVDSLPHPIALSFPARPSTPF